MKTCSHCGLAEHPTEKRMFQCGTRYSGTGVEYRSTACRAVEAANLEVQRARQDAEQWSVIADRANEARDLALHDKLMAEQDAARYKEFADRAQANIDAEVDKVIIAAIAYYRRR